MCVMFRDTNEQARFLQCAHKWADATWAHMSKPMKVLRQDDKAYKGGEKGFRERTKWERNAAQEEDDGRLGERIQVVCRAANRD